MTVYLVKSWEDEERDEQGRWASGGGEGQGRLEGFGGPKWEDAKDTVRQANVGQPYGTKDPAVHEATTTNDHPDTYYHTSKTTNRDSIQANGLEAGRSLGGKNTRVYLAEDRPDSKPRTDMAPHDTYEVDVRGLPLRPDPENPEGWAISEQDISPDRIKLVGTSHPDGMPKSFGGDPPPARLGPRQRVRTARGVDHVKGAAPVADLGHRHGAVAAGLDGPATPGLLDVGAAGHASSVAPVTPRLRLFVVKDWEDEERDAQGRWTSGGGESERAAYSHAQTESAVDQYRSGGSVSAGGSASMDEASAHIAEGAKAFHDAGGTIETITADQANAIYREGGELDSLLKGLIAANGGNELSDRIMSGFRLANSAAGTARTMASATVRVARTPDGHIAAICSSSLRPTTFPDHLELGLMGSTGIMPGAGSALTQEVMKDAQNRGLGVSLEALDKDAEGFWRGQLGASVASATPGVSGAGLGWTAGDTAKLAMAA